MAEEKNKNRQGSQQGQDDGQEKAKHEKDDNASKPNDSSINTDM